MMYFIPPPGLSEAELQDLLERWANSGYTDTHVSKKPRIIKCDSCNKEISRDNSYIYLNDSWGVHLDKECLESFFNKKDEKYMKQLFKKEK